jgi:Polyketide cyclase / dehydrase and lipid transport
MQDVHAPPEYVWDRILDFENYPKMVPKVSKCGNYEVENLRNGTDILKTRMVMNVFGVKFDNYILHKHYKSLDSLTWTLDYSRRSTLGQFNLYLTVSSAVACIIDICAVLLAQCIALDSS